MKAYLITMFVFWIICSALAWQEENIIKYTPIVNFIVFIILAGMAVWTGFLLF